MVKNEVNVSVTFRTKMSWIDLSHCRPLITVLLEKSRLLVFTSRSNYFADLSRLDVPTGILANDGATLLSMLDAKIYCQRFPLEGKIICTS